MSLHVSLQLIVYRTRLGRSKRRDLEMLFKAVNTGKNGHCAHDQGNDCDRRHHIMRVALREVISRTLFCLRHFFRGDVIHDAGTLELKDPS